MPATILPRAEAAPPLLHGAAAAPATDLQALLAPRAVAVIGASRRPGTMGHQILHNLIEHGFTGAVYPVNPGAKSICAVRAYASIGDVPDPVDLAVVVVPHPRVQDVVRQCCDAGVKGLVVISAGFREVGEAGAERERQLTELVRERGVRMVGPNCMGIVNADPAVSMNATFATVMPPFGHSAFVSQSGALGLSVLDHAREYGIGISQFVSVGNKPDVSGNDLLEQWEHDDSVRVILMYVESFGNPRRFLEIASRITKTKPVIAVKAGRSPAGARAASSHTGALAASDTAVDAMLAQAGVLRASTVEELFDMAIAFESRALPRSRRVAVLTNAGGPGILAADALETCGLELAPLGEPTVAALRPLFPAEASIRNPLDMVASATPPGYTSALSAILGDPAVDSVMPIFVPPFGIRQEDVADAIVRGAAATADKPVLAVLMGREGLPYGRAGLHAAGIPAYVFPESAARGLAALCRHVEWTRRPPASRERFVADHKAAARIISAAQSAGGGKLPELDALELLRAYGIPIAAARMVTDEGELMAAATAVGYPLVLKVVSPDITHKTDVGGVVTGLASDEEVRAAYTRMLADVHAHAPSAHISGVLVQAMASGGVETIVGISRDPNFGPLVMFGLGGIFVEAMRDVVFRMAPVDHMQATDMVTGIRAASVLRGVRGRPASDLGALATAVQRIAQLADDFPQVAELDVNPLLALADGVLAVDARVQIAVDALAR